MMELSIVDSGDRGAGSSGRQESPTARQIPRSAVSAWMVSILLHAVLFFAMFLLVFPYTPAAEVPETITRSELVGDPDATSSGVSSADLPTQSPMRKDTPVRIQPRRTDALAGMESLKKRSLSIIGIGTGRSDSARYGLSVGGGGGPEFFGLGGTARGARRIVYVVDRSGSMLGIFDIVRRELKRSVSKLRRSQRFHVILFNSRAPLENPPRRLVSAIQAHKKKLFAFLDNIMPDGGTDPGPAMRLAFSAEPDLIYFLTDGQFDDKLLAQLDAWNKNRRTRIFTIAFFGAGGADLLEQIAREHKGEFRFVSEDELP